MKEPTYSACDKVNLSTYTRVLLKSRREATHCNRVPKSNEQATKIKKQQSAVSTRQEEDECERGGEEPQTQAKPGPQSDPGVEEQTQPKPSPQP